jgi:hypothetical protein
MKSIDETALRTVAPMKSLHLLKRVVSFPGRPGDDADWSTR